MYTPDDSDRHYQAIADAEFELCDAYERGVIAQQGTAFTTYEDLGPEVCAFLEARCRSWVCANYDSSGHRIR